MSTDTSKILGVVVLARHGDRRGFYQAPTSYTPSLTTITPLGTRQEFQLGQTLRSLYLNKTSPSNILSINATVADQTQLWVRADAGGEGGVIFDSAVAMLQGLFPSNPNITDTLANGTTLSTALNGYQYVPIESVEPNNDVSLEGWTSCAPFVTATNAFYASPEFAQKKADHQSFLAELPPFLDGRQVTLENMWNIFDYMNVQSIHNATFANRLPPTFLPQARDLANWHEYNVFSSPQVKGIGNIAGQTILPSLITSFNRIVNASDPLKFVFEAISYKPFLSLFNMTGVTQAHPELASIVDYAAVLALEIRLPANGGEPFVRFNFKNGSTVNQFTTYPYMGGSGDVPVSTFIQNLAPSAINTTAQWCAVCKNTQDRGCDEITLTAPTGPHDAISPVGAGFVGAGVLAAVILAGLVVLFLFGKLNVGKVVRPKAQKRYHDDTSSEEKA